MHCRENVMPILIERRMKKWRSILRCPIIAPECSPARARRNLLRLLVRHEAIGKKLGLTVAGIYSL
jgi:hypothetical protein